MDGYIYLITNLINGKRYIGQTTEFYVRMGAHLNGSESKKSNEPLFRAVKKYGKENFSVEILQHLRNTNDSNLTGAEQGWVDHFDSIGVELYNIKDPINSKPRGKYRKYPTEEVRRLAYNERKRNRRRKDTEEKIKNGYDPNWWAKNQQQILSDEQKKNRALKISMANSGQVRKFMKMVARNPETQEMAIFQTWKEVIDFGFTRQGAQKASKNGGHHKGWLFTREA